MAQQKSKRKRRNPGSAPHAVPSQRRTERAQKQAVGERERRRRRTTGLDARGERPPSPFGGLPVSEFMIFVGGVALVVGFINNGGPALIVGIVVMALGVLEVNLREHFTGYRSHVLLLALFPTVAIEIGLVILFGGGKTRITLFAAVLIPVYVGIAFWLRGRYRVAHQRRIARPPRA